MTFTWTPEEPTDITRVRHALGDSENSLAIFSDEEITFALQEEGGVGPALVSLIHAIIARLQHEPDLRADWLGLDWRRSSEHWWRLLANVKQRYDLADLRQVTTRTQLQREDLLP